MERRDSCISRAPRTSLMVFYRSRDESASPQFGNKRVSFQRKKNTDKWPTCSCADTKCQKCHENARWSVATAGFRMSFNKNVGGKYCKNSGVLGCCDVLKCTGTADNSVRCMNFNLDSFIFPLSAFQNENRLSLSVH